MSLDSLAYELLEAIFQHLVRERHTRALFSVCLTSRRLSSIGLQSLYAVLDLRTERRKMGVLDALQRCKVHGTYVRTLFARSAKEPDQDEIMLFLLSVMPNLREVYFGVTPISTLLMWFEGAGAEALPNLKSLSIAREAFESGINNVEISECLSHPSLRKLSIRPIHDPRPPPKMFEQLAGTSNITELSLNSVECLTNTALKAILCVPKQLKRLSVEPRTSPNEGDVLSIPTILSGLERSFHSLVFLRITYDDQHGRHPEPHTSHTPFPDNSLVKFTALKELQTNLALLLTTTNPMPSAVPTVVSFPGTLQVLIVNWDGPKPGDTDAFVNMLSVSCPKALRSLCVRGRRQGEPSKLTFCPGGKIGLRGDSFSSTLDAACQANGIDFVDERWRSYL